MKRLAISGIVLIALLVGGAQAAGELTLTVVSQTNSTITLGWTPQAGYGYLFSVNGSLVSRTNDAARSSVKFTKVTNGVYEVAVIVKGATGTYPPAAPPPPPPPPKAACANGLDDDGDGKVDYPADPGCTSDTDTDETDPPPPPPPPPTGYPDASNTGVLSGTVLTAYTGPSNVTTANTVISGKTISGGIQVSAPGVVIRNSRINGAVWVDDRSFTDQQTPLLIEDSEITCGGSGGTAIGEADIIVRRSDIWGCENGFDVNQNITVEDSYIHDLWNGSGSHMDGIQLSFGHWNGSSYPCCALNVTIRHNTIYAADPNGSLGTSSIISNGDGGDVNILIDNNLMAGGAYTLYCDGWHNGSKGTNYRVTNNHFSTRFSTKVGEFGVSNGCSDEIQSGNVIHETNQPLTLG